MCECGCRLQRVVCHSIPSLHCARALYLQRQAAQRKRKRRWVCSRLWCAAVLSSLWCAAVLSNLLYTAVLSHLWCAAVLSSVWCAAVLSNLWCAAVHSNLWCAAVLSHLLYTAVLSHLWCAAVLSNLLYAAVLSNLLYTAVLSKADSVISCRAQADKDIRRGGLCVCLYLECGLCALCPAIPPSRGPHDL